MALRPSRPEPQAPATQSKQRSEPQELAALQPIEDDAAIWSDVKACAKLSTPCASKFCYETYRLSQSAGVHLEEATAGLVQAQAACVEHQATVTPILLPNGKYSAFARPACGEHGSSVPVTLQNGEITWDYGRGSQPALHWTGSVGADGTIAATVGVSGYSAKGRYPTVAMHFPGCEVSLQILNHQ